MKKYIVTLKCKIVDIDNLNGDFFLSDDCYVAYNLKIKITNFATKDGVNCYIRMECTTASDDTGVINIDNILLEYFFCDHNIVPSHKLSITLQDD